VTTKPVFADPRTSPICLFHPQDLAQGPRKDALVHIVQTDPEIKISGIAVRRNLSNRIQVVDLDHLLLQLGINKAIGFASRSHNPIRERGVMVVVVDGVVVIAGEVAMSSSNKAFLMVL